MKKAYLNYNKKLKTFSRDLRNDSTPGEIKLWMHLRAGSMLGYKFNRQKPLGNYIADFYCKKLDLLIEIDGLSHLTKIEYDKKRDAYMQGLGLTVLRFSEQDTCTNINGVLNAIENYIIDLEKLSGREEKK